MPITHSKTQKTHTIPSGTQLFRITSPSYADKAQLLNGGGGYGCSGRYHRKGKATSYVADDVLLCVCEKLSHMCEAVGEKLRNASYTEAYRFGCCTDTIVAFECNEIPNLVYLESFEILQGMQLNPSMLTNPAPVYDPLQHAAENIRGQGYGGVLYPSARHSRGIAASLFGDHSDKVASVTARLSVRLSLVTEDGLRTICNKSLDLTRERISYNYGYFAIDAADYSQHQYRLVPCLRRAEGYVDFQRPFFGNAAIAYPDCAVHDNLAVPRLRRGSAAPGGWLTTRSIP